MRKTKVKGLALALMLFAVLAFGTANAEVYTVKKGDCLSKIAKEYGVSIKELHKANKDKIKNINLIYPGQKFTILETGTVKITSHNTSPYGAKGVKGDKKVMDGIDKTSYPAEIKEALKKVVSENDPLPYILMKGEKVEYFSDRKGVHYNPKGYEFAWKKLVALPAYAWTTVEIGDKRCEVIVIDGCGNFASRCETIEKPAAPPEEKVPEIPVKVEIPEEAVTPPEIPTPEIPKIEKKLAIEHEPIIGAWYWTNELAHGWGGYGEYVAWLREEYPWGYANGWSPGIGIYGMYSEGDSKLSAYEWKEKGIGPQIGLKYIGQTDEGKPWQWQGKIRLLWEHMDGKNPESGYHMSQNNLKLGLYTEILKRTDPNWIIGATAEGWYAPNRSMNSTWSGDHPGSRTQLAVNALAQYKVSDDVSVRGILGPFYQGWDKLWGVRITGELRLWETVMLGPSLSFYPFGLSKAYEGIAHTSELTTLTGFVRLELGSPIRELDRKARMERVKKLDEEKYGVIEEENPAQPQPIDNPEKLVSINYTNDPVPYISPNKFKRLVGLHR